MKLEKQRVPSLIKSCMALSFISFLTSMVGLFTTERLEVFLGLLAVTIVFSLQIYQVLPLYKIDLLKRYQTKHKENLR